MLIDAVRIHEHTLDLVDKLVADMSDAELSAPMAPGHHTGMWVLGHLGFALDRARMRLGHPDETTPERMAAFGPGSKPDAPFPPDITKAQLLSELRESARVAAAVKAADPEALSKPHGFPWLEGTALKTLDDVLSNLLTAHAAYHVGQLSVYRRALGRDPLH